MLTNDDCFLCGELEHHGGRIALIDDLQIVSDIAPLNNGHILLSSKKHILSYSTFERDELDRIEQIVNLLKTTLMKLYKQKIILFEHGMGDACDLPACGIDHCHIHLMPIPFNDEVFGSSFVDFLNNLGLDIKFINLERYNSLKLVEGMNYLFTEDINDEKKAVITSHHFPAQVLRRYIAMRLGSPYTYDWQIFYNEQEAKKTTRFLNKAIKADNLIGVKS